MRIISGTHKSRRFYPPESLPIRPTTDFAKTGLFNILSNYYNFENIKVLDLFAGSGSISYEFASRGCQNITTVDEDNGCVNYIRKMAGIFDMEDEIHIYEADVFEFLKHCDSKFDVVFAGPPYRMENIEQLPELVISPPLLTPKGFFILEHWKHISFENHPCLAEVRNYGKTYFSIFRLVASTP